MYFTCTAGPNVPNMPGPRSLLLLIRACKPCAGTSVQLPGRGFYIMPLIQILTKSRMCHLNDYQRIFCHARESATWLCGEMSLALSRSWCPSKHKLFLHSIFLFWQGYYITLYSVEVCKFLLQKSCFIDFTNMHYLSHTFPNSLYVNWAQIILDQSNCRQRMSTACKSM